MLLRYLKNNLLSVINSFLLATAVALLTEFDFELVKKLGSFFSSTKPSYQFGLFSLVAFGFLIFKKQLNRFWLRYLNTYKLVSPRMIHVDFAVLTLFFLSLWSLILFRGYKNISDGMCLSIASILILFLILKSEKFKKKTEREVRSTNFLLNDTPISNMSFDLLNRKEFVQNVANEIDQLLIDESFVYGLYGQWGDGKTSTLNLLEKELEDKNRHVITEFDPWYFKDEEAIIAGFLTEIEAALSRDYIFPNLKKTFKKYRNVIEKGVGNGAPFLDLFDTDEGPEDIKARIENFAIEELNKKVIIFIDNIDRLDKRESQLVFKLVRLCSNFKNTVFIMSLDPIVVEGRLGLEKDYLEKIIQKPINLPRVEKRYIDAFFELALSGEVIEEYVYPIFSKCSEATRQKIIVSSGVNSYKFIDDLKRQDFDSIENSEDRIRAILLWETSCRSLFSKISIGENDFTGIYKDFPIFYRKSIRPYLTTLRKAKRYFNGLASTLPAIYEEVHLLDFLGLEILRVFFPELYNDIWENYWVYIPAGFEDYGVSPFFMANDEEKYKMIKKHIEEKLEKLSAVDSEKVKNLLEELFFIEVKNAFRSGGKTGHDNVMQKYRSERRLTHSSCFKKYFSFQTPRTELPDSFVKQLILAWHESEIDQLVGKVLDMFKALQEQGKLTELFEKIALFRDSINEDVAIKIIDTIVQYSEKLSKKDKGDFWTSELDKADYCLLRLLNDRVSKDKIPSVIPQIINNSTDLYFMVLVINSCSKEEKGSLFNVYESINIQDELKNAQTKLREFFVDEKRNLFELYPGRPGNIIFWYWAKHWETQGSKNKDAVEYLYSIFENDSRWIGTFFAMNMELGFRGNEKIFRLESLDSTLGVDRLLDLAQKYPSDGDNIDVVTKFITDVKKWKNQSK